MLHQGIDEGKRRTVCLGRGATSATSYSTRARIPKIGVWKDNLDADSPSHTAGGQ